MRAGADNAWLRPIGSWRYSLHQRLGIPLRAALLTALLLAAPWPGLVGNAWADLKLCNMTTSQVGVAIGYKSKDGWVAEGWWNIPSISCETLLIGDLRARFYYIYAVDYDRGGEWAGKAYMCTAPKAFTIKGVERCAERGYKKTGFIEIDTGNATDWTVRLKDAGNVASSK